LSGQTITDPSEMVNQFRTDRTQANSKNWIKVIKEDLEWCKQYGLDFIIRDNTNYHSIYQGHTKRKGVNCPKVYSYMTSKSTLQEIAYLLQNYAVLFQDRYIFEWDKVTNKKRFEVVLKEVNS